MPFILRLIIYLFALFHNPFFRQVQIQGEQGQVLQVASPTHQQLSGVTTAQLVQQGDLTEEQQQQVWMVSTWHEHNPSILLVNRWVRVNIVNVLWA